MATGSRIGRLRRLYADEESPNTHPEFIEG